MEKLNDNDIDSRMSELGGDVADEAPSRVGELSQDDELPLDDEDVATIGDLGNDFDDPEGWMSERPDYWTDLAGAPLPSRASFLRHRIVELMELLKALSPNPAPAWPSERVAEAVWRGAVEDAFGTTSFPAILVNSHPNEAAMTPAVEPRPRVSAIDASEPSVGALSDMTVVEAPAGMTEFPRPRKISQGR